jgi:uracil-DNA glycosylase family 4
VLTDAYITAAARCAPPENKPSSEELLNCSQYLLAELQILKNVRVVIALGKIAFDAYCKAAGAKKGQVFVHGAEYRDYALLSSLGNGRTLVASYHPSRQNTNTGRLSWQMWIGIFKTARSLLLEQ